MTLQGSVPYTLHSSGYQLFGFLQNSPTDVNFNADREVENHLVQFCAHSGQGFVPVRNRDSSKNVVKGVGTKWSKHLWLRLSSRLNKLFSFSCVTTQWFSEQAAKMNVNVRASI